VWGHVCREQHASSTQDTTRRVEVARKGRNVFRQSYRLPVCKSKKFKEWPRGRRHQSCSSPSLKAAQAAHQLPHIVTMLERGTLLARLPAPAMGVLVSLLLC